MKPVVIGIVGTRHELPFHVYSSVVDRIQDFIASLPDGRLVHIVSGGQTGVDSIARKYAKDHGHEFSEFAESAEVGDFTQRLRKRNDKIAKMATHMLAFPCEHSRGTWDTIRRFDRLSPTSVVAQRFRVDCLHGMRVQWWLVTLDQHGNPQLIDGAHDSREGADQAMYLHQSLGLTSHKQNESGGVCYAVARIELSEPKPTSRGVNHEAVRTMAPLIAKAREKKG